MTPSSWQPSATLATLRRRAEVLQTIRQFFAERHVLEVETPLLAPYTVTDPHMDVLTADNPSGSGDPYFLQTSPEYAMKRLLAAGSGSIFQICKAFRKGERSRRHNPEFTMLEWYRPNFSMFDLMDEVEALFSAVMGSVISAKKISYHQLLLDTLDIDLRRVDCQSLAEIARAHIDIQMRSDSIDDWLDLLMAEVIEPRLKSMGPVFVFNYPESQAALAKLAKDADGNIVAQRFELYAGGLELANGYHELTDVAEQRKRFEADAQKRRHMGRPPRAADPYLLAALESGLPACSGVALGLDRLLMLAAGQPTIADVISFTE